MKVGFNGVEHQGRWSGVPYSNVRVVLAFPLVSYANPLPATWQSLVYRPQTSNMERCANISFWCSLVVMSSVEQERPRCITTERRNTGPAKAFAQPVQVFSHRAVKNSLVSCSLLDERAHFDRLKTFSSSCLCCWQQKTNHTPASRPSKGLITSS